MIAVDTDVLMLAFAFHRDTRRDVNARFLAAARETGLAAPIYAVMELLGQLSFNLTAQRLRQWPMWLQSQYRLTIIYPQGAYADVATFFLSEFVDRPLARMGKHPIPYLDCLMIELLEQTPGVESFVTWNARHYTGRTRLPILTPAEEVARQEQA